MQVTFIACVRNMSKTATNVGYLLEDGTGQKFSLLLSCTLY